MCTSCDLDVLGRQAARSIAAEESCQCCNLPGLYDPLLWIQTFNVPHQLGHRAPLTLTLGDLCEVSAHQLRLNPRWTDHRARHTMGGPLKSHAAREAKQSGF